jgi:hypothetical protein
VESWIKDYQRIGKEYIQLLIDNLKFKFLDMSIVSTFHLFSLNIIQFTIEREGNLYKIDFIDRSSSSTIVKKYLIGQEVTSLSLWRV